MILESVVREASSGFGMFDIAEAPVETTYKTVADFVEFMDREYSWRWAEELNGKIYNQDGGLPFAWTEHGTGNGEENYGIIYVTV